MKAPVMTKDQWGPRGWDWLHTTAIGYAHEPTDLEKRAMFYRIWNFVSHLPCAECRGHATRYVAAAPPDLGDTYALQAWAWKFHNAVNARLGKRLVSYEEYQRLYADQLCWTEWGPGCQDADRN